MSGTSLESEMPMTRFNELFNVNHFIVSQLENYKILKHVTHTHIYIHINKHAHINTHIHTYISTHAHTHTRTRTHTRYIYIYIYNFRSETSLESEMPMTRLSELFNVNHFIVSQVNPHVVPFLSSYRRNAIVSSPVTSSINSGTHTLYIYIYIYICIWIF